MADVSQPPLTHRPTSATLHQSGSEPNNQPGRPSDSKSEYASDPHVEEAGPSSGSSSRINTLDILWCLGIFIMLVWPWIFFGVVWAKDGIQMNNHMAKVVTDNPHATTYFITLICSIISMIVSALFSIAIIRFAQELVTHRKPTRPFHLRVLLAFRHQTWPWGKSWKDVKYLLSKDRWWAAALVVLCVLTFPNLISSTTSLLTPAPFNKTAILTGTELDFSSTDSTCVAWFEANPLANNCDWQSYKGLQYTSCLGENQMVDVLEAGRGNILELLSNNTESLTFSQLGAKDGLHFLGSIRGVLPIGPNGVPAFDTLEPSPFDKPKIVAGMTFYEYTLNHQGLTSNISCSYEPTSPIVAQALIPNVTLAVEYNATCADLGETEVLTNVPNLKAVNGNSSLAYWACQSAPNGIPSPSYSIYLRGRGGYGTGVGNITCTISPIQPAIYPVTYQSTAHIFSAKESISSSQTTFSALVSYVLVALGGIISEGQSFQANLVAESVITFGVKSFGLPPYQQDPQYLRLYEQMIQGILEYETTYIRLIYSTIPNPPSSCLRTVTGPLTYQVLGWFVTSANIGFIIPMTLINLAALVALFLAVVVAKRGGHIFHPSHPRPVTYHEHLDQEEHVPDEWKQKVTFQPTTVLKEYFNSNVKGNLTGGVQDLVQAGKGEAQDRAEDYVLDQVEEKTREGDP